MSRPITFIIFLLAIVISAGMGFAGGCRYEKNMLEGLSVIGLMGQVRALTTIVEMSNAGEHDKALHALSDFLKFLRGELIQKKQQGFSSAELDGMIAESKSVIEGASTQNKK